MNTNPETTGGLSGMLNKVKNLRKGSTLADDAYAVINSQFVTSSLIDINLNLEVFGFKLGEKDTVSVLPFIMIEGLKSGVEFSKPLPLYREKGNKCCVIHIKANAAFSFYIKNKKGEVMQTIKFSAGETSKIIRIKGDINNYTLEGEINV